MERIGVLTSGGDSPGMNAAIRGVVRAALSRGVSVTGFLHGWQGVIDNEAIEMTSRTVGGIIDQGGTILRTARSAEFRTQEGRLKALNTLADEKVEGLVVIGGDGSLTGAKYLAEEHGFPVVGVPGSIDNDISGSDYSIGFDTAVNTAVDAIDKVRDTAYSHDRVFVIEVMGRANGFIALEVALSCGAEAVIVPELPYSIGQVCENLRQMSVKGKKSALIIVAEGAARASDIKDFVQSQTGFDARYLVLGHMQRGGSPSAFDRVLALRLGAHAAHRLITGHSMEMSGVDGEKLVSHPLTYVLGTEREIDPDRVELVGMMAR